ncbi:MAG: hypothetical protein U9O55_03295 [Patescibacteria group bacterium]|nr:hypothetical protein [Patescibacteria group bacterium]
MFFKFKKQKKEEKNNQENSPEQNILKNEREINIHIMPNKFLREAKQESRGLSVFIFILIFIAVGCATLYFFQDDIFPNGLPFISNNVNENSELNLNTDNSNKTANVNNANTLNRNYNINNNSNNINNSNNNSNGNTNTNVNTNGNVNINKPVVSIASDKDKDMLTDQEEALYQSNPNNPDTDNDGFLDGQEVANLYSPLTGEAMLLEYSGMTKNYINSTYSYSIIYPISWKVVSLAGGDKEIAFVSENKEFIKIIIIDNQQGLNAEQWYLEQIPSNMAYKVERLWVNNFMGVKSLDGMHFYLTPISGRKNFIYSVSYIVGSHMNITYPSTFKMIVRSFDIDSNRKEN